MAEIGRLLRTAAHTRPAQVWHRARLSLRRAWWERRSGAVDARYRRRAAALRDARFDHPGLARVAEYRTADRAEALLATARDAQSGRFTFLHRTRELGASVDWYAPELDVGTRLWKTHLHEFSFAPALAFAHRREPDAGHRRRLFELIASWSEASPIGRRDFALDSWNARAVATRSAHWAVAGSLLGLRPDEPDARALGHALAVHGLFLRDNLELDLRGNHLLRDAVGLVFAHELCGGVPDAVTLLESQVAEQVLPDGCHVERAPMYHAICLADLLETRLLLGDDAPAWLADAISRMAGLLESLLLGDGDLPLLGDGWLGEVDVARLLDACRRAVGSPPPPRDPERHGGLVGLRAGPVRAVMRAGPHGPDYQLGHAHADGLSFDLSLGATRVVTDTGTSLYDPGEARQRLRATAAHNTLQLDGAEQIEAWASFRVGRRGRARVVARGSQAGWEWVWAVADHWRWLPGGPLHARLLAVREDAALVLDAVTGSGRHKIASRLHIHPDCSDEMGTVFALAGTARSGPAPYHGHFGETREATRWEVTADAAERWFGGWWIPCASDAQRGGSDAPRCELRVRDGAAFVTCPGDGGFTAIWRPEAAADADDAVSFCSTERESAT